MSRAVWGSPIGRSLGFAPRGRGFESGIHPRNDIRWSLQQKPQHTKVYWLGLGNSELTLRRIIKCLGGSLALKPGGFKPDRVDWSTKHRVPVAEQNGDLLQQNLKQKTFSVKCFLLFSAHNSRFFCESDNHSYLRRISNLKLALNRLISSCVKSHPNQCYLSVPHR